MPTFVRSIAGRCVLLAIIGATRTAGAQPFTLDQKIKPTELKLQPYGTKGSRADGRVYAAEITQTEPTQYFFVQGLSIYSPEYVGVTGEDPSAKLAVSLHKETWEQAHRQGEVAANRRWDARFKTSGDFGIKVTADHVPAKYALLVWSGAEVDAPIPSPFTGSTTGRKTTAGASSPMLYVIIGVLVIALVVVTAIKFKPARMCLLIGALATAPLIARTAFAGDGDYPKAVAEMLEQLKAFLEHQESVKDFWESLQALSSGEAVPDMTQRGPSLPSSCLEPDWKIRPEDRAVGANSTYGSCQCMATAVGKLRANRQMLEKLRILVANQKNFVDKATALGNSFSQLHTVLGLQWIGIKKESIDEPYAQFKTIANQKHKALMDAIEKDLKDISDCEARLGEPDWYAKYGFMYYEFLYAAYKPAF
jgi:hypothetical protein